jgi:CBS domain-containing protein
LLVKNILDRKGRDIISVKPDLTLEKAAKVLRENKIGVVVVSDKKGKMCGVLSERDIINAVGKKGADVLSCLASQYMTEGVYTCKVNDTIKDVMVTMTERRIRHLPVVESGNIEGMISIGDVV